MVAENSINESLDDFKRNFISRENLLMIVSNKDGEKIVVMFHSEKEKKIGIEELRPYVTKMYNIKVDHGIIVIINNLTKKAKEVLNIYKFIFKN